MSCRNDTDFRIWWPYSSGQEEAERAEYIEDQHRFYSVLCQKWLQRFCTGSIFFVEYMWISFAASFFDRLLHNESEFGRETAGIDAAF